MVNRMYTLTLLVTSLCLTLASGFAAQDEEQPGPEAALIFSPELGRGVEKHWVAKHTLNLVLLSNQVGEAEPENLPFEGAMDSSQELRVVDVLRRMGDRRPAMFERSFETIQSNGTLNVSSGPEIKLERSAILVSALAGLGVRYTWVPEEDSYGKFYYRDADQGDEYHLGPLGADLDLLVVLPGKAVRVGESWNLAPEVLVHLFAPCGDIQLRPGDSGDKSVARSLRFGVGGGLEFPMSGRSEGEVTVHFSGLREQDGRNLAVLDLRYNGRFANDKTKILGEDVLRREAVRGAQFNRIESRCRLEGKGEVLWDLQANRAHAMTLAASEDLSLRVIETLQDGASFIQSMGMRGLVQIEYTQKAASDPPPVDQK